MKNPSLLSRIHWPHATFFVLTPIIAAIAVPMYLLQNSLPTGLWIFIGVYSVLTSIGITGGYHRFLSHRSYDANTFTKIFYLFFGGAALQNSALVWCTDHRRHHRSVDTQDDPYSIQEGFFYAHMGWILLKENPKFAGHFEKDLKDDKWIALQDKYYLPLALFGCFGVPYLVGLAFGYPWGGFLIGGLARVVFTSHCTFFINSMCHFWGTQPYSDRNSARDNFWMAFFTYGEGYHNFHHRFQSDYRNGTKWYHWDPTKWFIYGLSRIGFTTRLKKIPQMMIVEARMEMDKKRLSQLGIPQENISKLWLKVDEAKKNWSHLHEEYLKLKQNWQLHSREKIAKFRFDAKLAQIQFKHTWHQWGYFVKKCKARPSLGL